MATMRVPVVLTWSGVSGSPGANIWHARTVSDAGSNLDLGNLTGFLEDFYTSIRGLYCSDLTIKYEGEATGVGDDTGAVFVSDPWTVTGNNGVDHLAPALQCLVNWKAATGGRSGRGRTFIGPLATGVHESNGTPDEAERTTLSDAAAELIEQSDTFGDGAWGIYSRTENIFRDFISSEVPNKFAVLRSRRD